MTSPFTVYKLMILYLLDRAEGEIAMDRISSFLLDNGYTGFLSLVTSYAELEESGLTRSVTKGERVFLRITGEGREALRCFSYEIGSGIKKHCDEWLLKNRIPVREEQAVNASFSYAEGGKYEVNLTLREGGSTALEIRMGVHDKETARRITENWEKENSSIYRFLIEKLT
ncbi:MAG: DUF4364 family protein [Lachnospiraceae bacterium]|nr:DUF4364 family protein [Lachnospiraceae bacterium]